MSISALKVDPNPLVFPATCMNSESSISFKLFNSGNDIIKYQWRNQPNIAAEEEAKLRLDILDPRVRSNMSKVFVFSSDSFVIDQLEGEIWPHQTQNIIAKFKPIHEGTMKATAYLTNIQTGDRIPIQIQGQCQAPDAQFDVSSINTGHIALDNSYDYQVILKNTGETDVEFSLIEEETSLKFEFTPKAGRISVGMAMPIQIRLYALKVGQFNETFRFKISGAGYNTPSLAINGRVMGPSFQCDTKLINFKTVSYGFTYKQTIRVTNVSDIPLDYNVQILQSANTNIREFNVYPEIATIRSKSHQDITVEFIPVNIQDYNTTLVMTNPKYSTPLLSIPIQATCLYPRLLLETPDLDIGNVFIGYTYNIDLNLVNRTKLLAKYEYEELNLTDEYGWNLEIPYPSGIIQPNTTKGFPIIVTFLQLGNHTISREIRVSGDPKNIIKFNIKALCIGPTLSYSQSPLSFGEIPVLTNIQQNIEIKNTSLINANYKVSFAKPSAEFKLLKTSGCILPGETDYIPIQAFLDDTLNFEATAQFLFEHLTPIDIQIKAKGTGNVLIPSIPMDSINLEYLFVGEKTTKEFTIHNKGRRNIEVRWSLQKAKLTPNNESFNYNITPEHVILNAYTAQTFTLTVISSASCDFEMTPQLSTTIKKQRHDIFTPRIFGRVNKVLIDVEKPVLTFVHSYVPDEKGNIHIPTEIKPIILENTITNTTPLHFGITATCQEPFVMSPTHFDMKPDESKSFKVTFNPFYKENYQSEIIDRKIIMKCDDNPQQFTIDLKGVIEFPNVTFPSTTINFGALSKSTEKTETVIIKNTQTIKADFWWEIETPSKSAKNVFDIFPTRGSLLPNSEDKIYVSFYAAPGGDDGPANFSGRAICHVIGGPIYNLDLKGSSAAFDYSITPRLFTFENCLATETLKGEFVLKSMSDFNFDYNVQIPKGIRVQDFIVSPMSGTLKSMTSQNFIISIVPGQLKDYDELFFIRIGPFDEERIRVTIKATFPRLEFDLQRTNNDQIRILNLNATSEQVAITEKKFINDRLIELYKRPSFVDKFKKPPLITFPKNFNGFCLSEFNLDFGEVMLGSEFEKTFNVRYVNYHGVGFEIIDKSLKQTGFIFECTKWKDLNTGDNLPIKIKFSSQERKTDVYGNVCYKVPFVICEDFGYILYITAIITAPSLTISENHITYENTIIGETRIVTLQVQNMNNVPVTYTIHPAEYADVVKQKTVKNQHPVFSVFPTSGMLPPASFQNIEVMFTPTQDKNYQMMLPISVLYNSQMTYISLKGSGIQLKLKFEPEKIDFGISTLMQGPTTKTVNIINPSTFPIDIYSKQFDAKLLLKNLKNSQNDSTTNLEMIKSSSHVSFTEISSFSFCALVHGPPNSGKSEVSKILSKYLGDVPIVVLSEVWKDVPQNSKQSDYVQVLKHYLMNPAFANGFVIDGLNGLPLSNENEQYLSHITKTKGAVEEFTNDPLYILPHKEQTVYEQAIVTVLQAIHVHYFYFICLNVTENNLISRLEAIDIAKKQAELAKMKQELQAIFDMTEEEYQALTPEKQQEVDQKRENYRQKLMGIQENIEENKNNSQKKVAKPASTKKGKNAKNNAIDPVTLNQQIFTYSLGSVINTALQMSEDFVNFDKTLNFSEEEEEKPMTKNGHRKSVAKPKDIVVPKLMERFNVSDLSMSYQTVLVISGNCSIDQQNSEIYKFVPEMNDLKAQAFMRMIEPPKAVIEEGLTVPKLINQMPNTFSIKQDISQIQNYYDEYKNIAVERAREEWDIKNKEFMDKLKESLENQEKLQQSEIEPVQEPQTEKPPGKQIRFADNVMKSNNSTQESLEKSQKSVTIGLDSSAKIENPTKSSSRLENESKPPVKLDSSAKSTTKIENLQKQVKIEGETKSSSKLSKSSPRIGNHSKLQESIQKSSSRLVQELPHFDESKVALPPMTQIWHIEPGKSIPLEITFNSSDVGTFTGEIYFGILNAIAPPFKIPMEGKVIHPDIERSMIKIFQGNVTPKLTPKTEMTFVTELNEFHFGSQIILKDKAKGKAAYKSSVHLTNITDFPAEISLSLSDSNSKGPWALEKDKVTIKPNSSVDVWIGFTPITADTYKNTLTINIVDNPDPLQINFVGMGCIPIIECQDQNIDFEKLLVNQSRICKFELKNSGRIPAFWRIKGGNTLGNMFNFSALEGMIMPKQSTFVEVKYESPKPFSIKKQIQIDVMDKTKLRTFSALHINFTAETFDANFEIVFPKGMDCINFGDLKANNVGQFQLGIKSKSKYPLLYKFNIMKNSLQKIIKINPMEGGVQPDNKPVMINISCQTNSSQKYDKAKGIMLKMIDCVSGQEIANVPILFSAKILFSTFSINPNENVDFGNVSTNTTTSNSITIQNICPFPFDYELIPVSQQPQEPETPRSTNPRDKKKGGQKPLSPRPAKGKKTQTVLQINDFTLSPSFGTVNPNETATILAELSPLEAAKIQSQILVKISDCSPQYANGIPLNLLATAFTPCIDDINYDLMFPGIPIAVKADLQMKDFTAFLPANKLLHMGNTTVGQTTSLDFVLNNPNPVSCSVSVDFKVPPKTQNPFSLSEKSFDIDAKSSKKIQISFTPSSPGLFTAQIVASVKGGTTSTIDIEGNGALPEISLESAGETLTDEPVRFGQILVGSQKVKHLTIRNIGKVTSHVTLSATRSADFTVNGDTEYNILSGEFVNVPIVFKPEKVRHSQIEISVKVEQNESQNRTIQFAGDGNREEILFDGLPNDDSELVFRESIIGSQQKITFTMRSVSQSTIRFVWGRLNDFTFVPSIGHIRAGESKKVTVTFMSNKPVTYNSINQTLSALKIKLEDENCEHWDDSLKDTKFITRREKAQLKQLQVNPPPEPKNTARKFPGHAKSRKESVKAQVNSEEEDFGGDPDELVKYVEVHPEPPFTPTKEKRDITLKISAASDLIKYNLDATTIEFPPTMMYTKVPSYFTMTNTCGISFTYRWFAFKFQSLRGDADVNPFSITPSEGQLKPGESQTFTSIFIPKEVDEFSSIFRCEIPFLTSALPELTMTGISRRPICHLGIDPNDYLTSGRRMPEFTDELPQDVRIVEISAKKVGEKTIRKIDIVNTTATSYEVIWTQQYDRSNNSVNCENPNLLISSGKETNVTFTFTPKSNKIVESLWQFNIPSYNVKAHVLIVGKVSAI
ncbi:hypothetical protein TVAG_449190 [Trichomonas vaginalis G3]|uniref:MSP domain-containing protein n=1 Tax=Trichomonas vaginalis (strain ATCC PRA-98 / G3) TaxID=412133 RepID=A2FI68_TRIV3|nr:deleted in lung and esophageal cancer 1 (DLEC1) family [Trichomonas vaginalis G3]EAX95386.1 hypothetical protein TVAG_449190 [Trichomonas vaginalis G3]KAI5503702.1 deleted in lung and esophageal cancer 1 (DLEC1) family [Trichomonas vaginalis G3]|eukprot:XP_001308316.1 hypothetical protein [Trichomonas vaginalis G3]